MKAKPRIGTLRLSAFCANCTGELWTTILTSNPLTNGVWVHVGTNLHECEEDGRNDK